MNISQELLEKAEAAKTAEELFELAKAENIEMTEEEAAKAFAELHKEGELADDELDNVTGGICENPSPEGGMDDANAVTFLYSVGQTIKYKNLDNKIKEATIVYAFVRHLDGKHYPRYKIEEKDENGNIRNYIISQNRIMM